jgi:signal transduction histidine kinase
LAEEKILQQNELLAKANKELDYFVYSVSHDLRAPLSSILGLANIYSMTADEQERADIIRMVGDRAQVLDNFIREVLDYSRNARLELKLHSLNLSEIVLEVLETFKHMEGFRNVEMRVDVDRQLTVTSDRERIKVILSNLLANAVNYRDHGKKSIITIRAVVNTEFWAVQIEDNGIGIKPEHHDRIFDMFYKAHDRSKGTGLGLYIVRETLHRLKGEIEVRSEYGKGSVFGFQVPMEKNVS